MEDLDLNFMIFLAELVGGIVTFVILCFVAQKVISKIKHDRRKKRARRRFEGG